MATGPYAVNWTWRSYVTPGISRLRTSWACAGPARTPAATAAIKSFLSTTRAGTVAEGRAGASIVYRLITGLSGSSGRPRARRILYGASPGDGHGVDRAACS